MSMPWGKIGLTLFIALMAATLATQSVLLGVLALGALGLMTLD